MRAVTDGVGTRSRGEVDRQDGCPLAEEVATSLDRPARGLLGDRAEFRLHFGHQHRQGTGWTWPWVVSRGTRCVRTLGSGTETIDTPTFTVVSELRYHDKQKFAIDDTKIVRR